MKKFLYALAAAAALLLVLATAALAWAAHWLGSEDFRARVQLQASARLGVPVSLGRVSLALWPVPAAALDAVVVATASPITVQRAELRPDWRALLQRQLRVDSLHIEGVDLPQTGLDALLAKSATNLSANAQPNALLNSEQALQQIRRPTAYFDMGLQSIPQRVVLDKLTWRSRTGEALQGDFQAQFNGARDHLQLTAQLAGGQVKGQLQLGWSDSLAVTSVSGTIDSLGLDVAMLPGLKARLGGRLDAQTQLQARAAAGGAGAGSLSVSLQTQTEFSVRQAVLRGIDLAKAVRTVGLSRGGQTPLDTLSGSISTRGSGAALTLALDSLKAQSGLLAASGAVQVGAANPSRALSGKIYVALGGKLGGGSLGSAVSSVAGLPIEVAGSVDAPQLYLSRSAMLGAAIGTALLPGAGSAAGAAVGDKLGGSLEKGFKRLFGK